MIPKIPEHLKGNSKYNLGTAFKHYRNVTHTYERVNRVTFSKVVQSMLLEIKDELIKGSQVKLPYYNGTLEIVTKDINIDVDSSSGKRKAMRVNFNECWKLWHRIYSDKTREDIKKIKNKPLVYFINDHTDGTFNSLKHVKSKAPKFNKALYTFKTAKGFAASLAKVSKEGKTYKTNTVY